MHPLLKKLAATYVNLDPDIEFPHLKAVTLAQWILEAGRNPSPLAREHFNFGGLKWREEMRGNPINSSATPVMYKAHDGEELYCKFSSLENFIRGYWRFIERSPYGGWRNNNSTPEDYIRFIGGIYTLTVGYADTILGILPETEALLTQVQANSSVVDIEIDRSETVTAANWIRIWDDPEGHIAEMSGSQLFKLHQTNRQISKLLNILSNTTAGTYVTESTSRIPIPEEESSVIDPINPMDEESEEESQEKSLDLASVRIALDVGHGYYRNSNGSGFDPGAVNQTAGIREVDLNLITATVAKEKLEQRGAKVSVFFYNNPNERLTLGQKGAKAQGHEIFVSCHHNAFDNPNTQGTETLIDTAKGTSEDKKLAIAIQRKLLETLNLIDRTRPKGFKEQGLGVLRGAAPYATAKCLIEPFFITKSGLTKSQAEAMSKKAGEALAEGITDYWLQNQ